LPAFKKRQSVVRRRYKEFERFREELLMENQRATISIPELPGKVLGNRRFTPEVIEERRKRLEEFLVK
jgi:sorting nexin-3/12